MMSTQFAGVLDLKLPFDGQLPVSLRLVKTAYTIEVHETACWPVRAMMSRMITAQYSCSKISGQLWLMFK